MISNFQIGNFKAFSDLQTIPLKPITIIFGPNSSGKSSVIHSLLLARHGVDTQSLDATYPSIAGQSVDLGGFRQYVHRRNFENRLQWVAEINVSALPEKLANDIAGADKISVHVTAGLQLQYTGQPVPGVAPFAQVCEYRIDGEPFLQLTRGAPKTDFKVSRLNRDHAVFKPILQAMLLSSSAQQALNEKDSKLLDDLIDSIVPNLAFPGSSDFLPGADMDPELLDTISRPSLYNKDEEQFEELGDLGRSVRLFLPRMITRFHSGVHQTMTNSLKSLTYLGPLRSIPPRHMAFIEDAALGHPAEGAQAWQELSRNKEVRDKVNAWLRDDKRLKTPYQLEMEAFFSQRSITDVLQELQEDIGLWTIEELLLHPDVLEGLARFQGQGPLLEPGTEPNDLEMELREHLEANIDHETLFELETAPSLRNLLAEKQELGSSDVRLFDIKKGTPVSHRDVGIGVSQVLPVLVQAYASERALIAMEQPEIHLHPALQAELGDVFIESALGENKNRFVLETHSEHLILRILRRIRESSANKNHSTPAITPNDIALLYVDPTADGARVMNLRADNRGRIIDRCPGGFFEEDFEELF